MRAQILLQRLPSGDLSYRICESDGELVARWMPGGPLLGALDKGGFDLYSDALSFKLGIDLVRAEAGMFDPEVSMSIRLERAAQDEVKQGRPKADQRPRVLLFEAA
jgi:hypothetical protein